MRDQHYLIIIWICSKVSSFEFTLCSARHPFAGRVDPAPDKKCSILMRNFVEFLSKLNLKIYIMKNYSKAFFFFTKLSESFLSQINAEINYGCTSFNWNIMTRKTILKNNYFSLIWKEPKGIFFLFLDNGNWLKCPQDVDQLKQVIDENWNICEYLKWFKEIIYLTTDWPLPLPYFFLFRL